MAAMTSAYRWPKRSFPKRPKKARVTRDNPVFVLRDKNGAEIAKGNSLESVATLPAAAHGVIFSIAKPGAPEIPVNQHHIQSKNSSSNSKDGEEKSSNPVA